MKNIFLNDYKLIFLDFDGVVVESADIKTQAFYELYLPYGKLVAEKARDYHIANQGVSRFKKFQWLHKNLLQKDCGQEEQSFLSEQFSKIVLEKILSAPFIEGVLNFLRETKLKKLPVFLLSATPDNELKDICKKRNLTCYFSGIYGTPFEKDDIGKKILSDYQISAKESVFVGDSISDKKAALAIGSKFIGRVIDKNNNSFDLDTYIINNFQELLI